jgi:hypothetical protein
LGVTNLALLVQMCTSEPSGNAADLLELSENGAFPDRKRNIAINETVAGQRKSWY